MVAEARGEAGAARRAVGLAGVRRLCQMELSGSGCQTGRGGCEEHRLGAGIEGDQYRAADVELFRDILKGVVARQAAIDQLTDRALVEKWPLGRIDATLRAVFRAAGYELIARPDIPPKVSIGEYVDVTKAFFSAGKEAKFVNAVLDHMAHEVRGEEMTRR